jgi:hypothetical protein
MMVQLQENIDFSHIGNNAMNQQIISNIGIFPLM